MRATYLGLACAGIGAMSFWATLFVLDGSDRGRSATERRSVTEIAPETVVPSSGAEVFRIDGGVRFASRFIAGDPGSTIGAAYANLTEATTVATGGRRLWIEVEATQASPATQAMEVLYVQNGLMTSGWLKMQLAPGRRLYSVSYAPPVDTRTGARVDTLWIRSDSTGYARPVVLHLIRLRSD